MSHDRHDRDHAAAAAAASAAADDDDDDDDDDDRDRDPTADDDGDEEDDDGDEEDDDGSMRRKLKQPSVASCRPRKTVDDVALVRDALVKIFERFDLQIREEGVSIQPVARSIRFGPTSWRSARESNRPRKGRADALQSMTGPK